jgi:hypothetical protein
MVMILSIAALLAGCGSLNPTAIFHGGGGALSVESLSNEAVSMRGGFQTGLYSFDGDEHITVLLYDGPIDNPTQAVTIRLLWRPQAGKTPIDPTATNATVHYVILGGEAGQAVGVYAGAGFLYPGSALGRDTMSAELWDASIKLTDSNAAFNDLLGNAKVEGGFRARRDDVGVEQAIRHLNMIIRDRLGRPRMVMAR